MSEASLEGSWPLAVLLTAALLVALTLFAHRNLPYAGFWYDEAVQFWVSRGVDPFAAPGRPPDQPAPAPLGHPQWRGFRRLHEPPMRAAAPAKPRMRH